jgi:integrase
VGGDPALAEHLGPIYGPIIVFAAATGLRPGEWIALEQRDVDRDARVVYVRRAFAPGRMKSTKTRRSQRAVPLQAIALQALGRKPSDGLEPSTPLSMRSDRQLVATGGNGFGLFEPFSGLAHLPG